SYYRSQHDNQSWLAAITAVLDTCAFLLANAKDQNLFQTQMTFAITRHAVVDLALVFKIPPRPPEADRLDSERLTRLKELFAPLGLEMRTGPKVDEKLTGLREMYEPFVN